METDFYYYIFIVWLAITLTELAHAEAMLGGLEARINLPPEAIAQPKTP